ncbi:hypothetical protein [Bradyrhizobium sp.]|uniref:head-tail joining protein n=1 Tax=Bradyrhizobium sp. TaxID=376 RepID=UPI00272F10D6|nr:hypothetical protein [Bradyrhizobium sp.]
MADIFAETFGAEEGAATYSPPDRSVAIPCRPIVNDEDSDSAEFAAKPRAAGKVISVRKSEVAAPVHGGLFVIGDISYSIVGKPVLDQHERAMWRCQTA